MKVGILAPPWVAVPPNAYGGTENLLAWLAEGLQGAGHEVLLFATSDSTCRVPRAATQASMPLENIGRIPAELRQVVDGYDALRSCDVIHDHTLIGPLVRAADAGQWPPICDGSRTVCDDVGPLLSRRRGSRVVGRDQPSPSVDCTVCD